MNNLLALTTKDLGGDIKGQGPLGLQNRQPSDILTLFPQIISTIIGVLTASAILWFVIQFILGTIRWISSQGDAKTVESARMQITHAIVGLVLVFSALAILALIGTIMGVDVINFKGVLEKLNPQGGGRGIPVPGDPDYIQ